MRKGITATLLSIIIICSNISFAHAAGQDPNTNDVARSQAIEKLNDLNDGKLKIDDNNGHVFISGKLSSKQQAGETSARQFLNDNKAIFGIDNPTKELVKKQLKKAKTGDSFVQFAQVINGIEVEGKAINVHFNKSGEIVSVNGNFIRDKTITTLGSDTISQDQAIAIAEKQFTYDTLREDPSVQRVIITKDDKNYDVYKVHISYISPDIGNYDVYVEAHSGKVIRTEDNIRYDGNVTGTGVDVSGVTRNLKLYLSGGQYQMKDLTNTATSGIYTYSLNHSTSSGNIVSSSLNSFNSEDYKASVSAHYFAGSVVDFYKQLFGRDSLDDNRMAIKSFTHYSTAYNNAYWDGYEMIYGDGDGSEFTYLSGDLDVVGHEMTHGLISNTADLTYHNQPGALNESLADTFGVLIETYSKYGVAGGGTWAFDPADWVVGDDIYTPGTPGDALRSLANPTLYDQPDNMYDYENLSDDKYGDYGGVHTNSGIPNKAAFLIAQAIGMQETANIYYSALVDYMQADTDFVGARDCLAQAAADLYGADSEEVDAVDAAFTAVKVGLPPFADPYEPNDTFATAYAITPGDTYQSYISNSTDFDYYKFNVDYTGNIHISLTNLPDNYNLTLWDSSHNYLDSSDNWGKTAESIDYNATSPGTYYVEVDGFFCYSREQMYSLVVNVPSAPVLVTGVSLDKHTLSVAVGNSSTLTATVAPSNATNKTVTWSSSDTGIATVDSSGKVTGVAKGDATVTATTADGSFKDTCDVTVTSVSVSGVTLNLHTLNVNAGSTATLTATVAPSNASNKAVTWSSSDTNIASVDSYGQVTGNRGGTATITAKTTDGAFQDTCAVTVIQAVTGVNMYHDTINMLLGDNVTLYAFVLPSDASNAAVTWTSSNPSVVSIGRTYDASYYQKDCDVTALDDGQATITVTTADGNFTDTCTITVTGTHVTSVALRYHTWDSNFKIGDKITLDATVSPANATYKALTWSSDNPSVATVIPDPDGIPNYGEVTATGSGRATITVTSKDGGFKDSCVVSVTTPLDKPVCTASDVTNNTSIISWGAVPGADGYEIYRWVQFVGNSFVTKTSSTQYTAAVYAGYKYEYSVRAYKNTDPVSYSSLAYVDFSPALNAPTAQIQSVAYNSITVSWNPVDGATYYEVDWSTSETGPSFSSTYITGSSCKITGLKSGTPYYVRVQARSKDPAVTFAKASDYSAFVSATPAMATPVSLSAGMATYNSISLSWSGVPDATKYEIYRSTSATDGFKLLTATSSTGYTNKSVNTDTTYYYKVRAYHLSGRTKVYGDFSNSASAVTTLGSPPTISSAMSSYNSIKISWGGVAGATKYEVYRSTDGDAYTYLAATSSKSYISKNLDTGTPYYYKVIAYRTVSGKKVYGSYSAVTSFTPTLGTPGGVSAKRASSTSIKLSWSSVAGATQYELYSSDALDGTYTLLTTTSKTSYTHMGLPTGVPCFYKIRAYRLVNTIPVYGGYSLIKSATP